MGLTIAGFPAESHIANRTHTLPDALKGIENRLLPKAGKSVADMT